MVKGLSSVFSSTTFKSINSSVLSLFYTPTLTSVHDYWKNHSFKEYVKAVYCHPAYLTSMQSTSCKMPGWINYKLESRLLGEKSIISDMQMIPLQIKRHLLLGRKAMTNLDSC